MSYVGEHEKGITLVAAQTGKAFEVGEYVKEPTDYVVDLTQDSVGMEYLEQDNQLYVTEVTPGLPAWQAGIPPNCKLARVDGIPPDVENPKNIMLRARAAGNPSIVISVRHEVGYVPPNRGTQNVEEHQEQSESEVIDEECEEFVARMFDIFDMDRDDLLSYDEYCEMMAAWKRQALSKNEFVNMFPSGYTRDHLLGTVIDQPPQVIQVLSDNVDAFLDEEFEEEEQFEDDDTYSSYLSESYIQRLERGPARDIARPLPSVWGVGNTTSSALSSSSMVHADLLNGSNEQLKRALIKCARELERRHQEVKDAHDEMEQGLRRVNSQAVRELGHDLETLLAKPATHQRANSWAAEKMRQIKIPPAALYSYHQHQRGRQPPPSASSVSSFRF